MHTPVEPEHVQPRPFCPRCAELEAALRMANDARCCPNCGGAIDTAKGHCIECVELGNERDARIAELERELRRMTMRWELAVGRVTDWEVTYPPYWCPASARTAARSTRCPYLGDPNDMRCVRLGTPDPETP